MVQSGNGINFTGEITYESLYDRSYKQYRLMYLIKVIGLYQLRTD